MAGSALLGSVTTKMRGMTVSLSTRASPLHRALALLGGRRSGPTSSRSRQPFSSCSFAPSGSTSTPPPINDKNLSQNKNVPGELHSAKTVYVKTVPKMAYFVLFGSAAFIYFWVTPRVEGLVNEVNALRRERSILIKAVEDYKRTHIQAKGVLSNSCEGMVNELNALCRERSILIKAVEDCQRTHIQAEGHGKERDGQRTSK